MDAEVTDTAGTPPEPDQPATQAAAAGEVSGAAEAPGATEDPGTAEIPGATGKEAPGATGAETSGATGTEAPSATGAETSGPTGTTSTSPPPPPPPHPRRWMRWVAGGGALVVLVGAGVGWYFYKKLDGNITTDTGVAAELRTWEKERPAQAPVAADAMNILLIGSDTRAGGNRKYGRDEGTQRSDTTIVLHLGTDRKSATGVSLPRDLMVDIPSCTKADGTRTRAMFAQFNWAYEMGGTACTIRTVEKLTGIRLDHHMVIDFKGFKDMVDAVDGVDVCLKKPIDDKDAHLQLAAGPQTLNGEQALGYVRARKSIGNGSDTERMERQQQFLASLVNKMQSNGVLLNPTKLYPVLDAATKSLTTDPGLASLRDLYDLASGMRNVPAEKVQFMTVPRQPYRYDTNRDELVTSQAERLFRQLREDAPVSVAPAKSLEKDGGSEEPVPPAGTVRPTGTPSSTPGGTAGSAPGSAGSGAPSPGPTPTFAGTNAATGMCE